MSAPPSAPAAATIDTVLDAIHGVGTKVDDLREDFEALKRRVDGSDPPVNGAEPLAKQARRGSDASFDVEELKRQLLSVQVELGKQSHAMGLDLGSGLRWLVSKDGRTTAVRLATLAGVVYAALHSAGVVK